MGQIKVPGSNTFDEPALVSKEDFVELAAAHG